MLRGSTAGWRAAWGAWMSSGRRGTSTPAGATRLRRAARAAPAAPSRAGHGYHRVRGSVNGELSRHGTAAARALGPGDPGFAFGACLASGQAPGGYRSTFGDDRDAG